MIPTAQIDHRLLDHRGLLDSYRVGYGDQEHRNEQGLLGAVGSQFAAGDYAGAAGTAMRGGKLDVGMDIKNWDSDRQMKALEFLHNAAGQANTPERWRAYVDLVAKNFGPDMVKGFEAFDARPKSISALEKARQEMLAKYQIQSELGQKAGLAGPDLTRFALTGEYPVSKSGSGYDFMNVDGAGLVRANPATGEATPLGIGGGQAALEKARQEMLAKYQIQSELGQKAGLAGPDLTRFALTGEYPVPKSGSGYDFMNVDGTGIVRTNSVTGIAEPLNIGGQARTKLTSEAVERARIAESMGITPENPEYQSYVLTGRLPKTAGEEGVSELEKQFIRSDVKRLQQREEDYTGAAGIIGNVNELEAARSLTSREGPVLDYLPNVSSEAKRVEAAALRLQMEFVNQTKGAVSDREMGLFASATPGMGMADAAAKPILGGMRLAARRVQERAKFDEEWMQVNGSLRGATAAWDRYVNENPILEQVGNTFRLRPENLANWSLYLGPSAVDRQPLPSQTPPTPDDGSGSAPPPVAGQWRMRRVR